MSSLAFEVRHAKDRRVVKMTDTVKRGKSRDRKRKGRTRTVMAGRP